MFLSKFYLVLVMGKISIRESTYFNRFFADQSSCTDKNTHIAEQSDRYCYLPICQVVESSSCITEFEALHNTSHPEKHDLLITCTMPSLEVGTVGGGTKLKQQRACLDMMNLHEERTAEHFARVICATVLCAELSLMAALQTNDLVKAHLLLNRARPACGDLS